MSWMKYLQDAVQMSVTCKVLPHLTPMWMLLLK